MIYHKKTWQHKLEDKEGYPKVLKLQEGFPCYRTLHKMGVNAGDDVVLVNPSDVVRLMKLVPEGKVTTLSEICQKLAGQYQVKGCCTLTSGIFVTLAAKAAEEAAAQGDDLGIPYWRTLKVGGYLNPKYPGGIPAQERHLKQEGLRLVGKGKGKRTENLEADLFEF